MWPRKSIEAQARRAVAQCLLVDMALDGPAGPRSMTAAAAGLLVRDKVQVWVTMAKAQSSANGPVAQPHLPLTVLLKRDAFFRVTEDDNTETSVCRIISVNEKVWKRLQQHPLPEARECAASVDATASVTKVPRSSKADGGQGKRGGSDGDAAAPPAASQQKQPHKEALARVVAAGIWPGGSKAGRIKRELAAWLLSGSSGDRGPCGPTSAYVRFAGPLARQMQLRWSDDDDVGLVDLLSSDPCFDVQPLGYTGRHVVQLSAAHSTAAAWTKPTSEHDGSGGDSGSGDAAPPVAAAGGRGSEGGGRGGDATGGGGGNRESAPPAEVASPQDKQSAGGAEGGSGAAGPDMRADSGAAAAGSEGTGSAAAPLPLLPETAEQGGRSQQRRQRGGLCAGLEKEEEREEEGEEEEEKLRALALPLRPRKRRRLRRPWCCRCLSLFPSSCRRRPLGVQASSSSSSSPKQRRRCSTRRVRRGTPKPMPTRRSSSTRTKWTATQIKRTTTTTKMKTRSSSWRP